MKKNIITLIALVVVLSGALAAFLLLRDAPEPETEPSSAADEIYVLGGVPQPFVKQVTIQNTLDTYTIVNNFQNAIQQQNADSSAPGYSIEGIAEEEANNTLLKSVMTSCTNLTAKKEVHAGGELSAYGLDKPVATVDVTYENGTGRMLIGNEAPGGEGTYVQADGKVYLVASSKLTNMLQSRFGFVGKTITGGNAEQSVFTKIAVTGGNFTDKLVVEKATEDSEASAMMGLGTYYISSPISSELDLDKGLTPLNSVFGLTATAVVASKDSAGLAHYGLEDPYMTVAVETEDEEIGSFTLSVSEPDEDGGIYIASSEKPFIYQLSAASLSLLDLDLFTIQAKMVVLPHIDTVSEVEVQYGGESYVFVLSGEGDDMAVAIDGKELDLSYFRKFYQTLIAASYDSEVEAGALESAESALESEVTADSAEGEEASAQTGEESSPDENATESTPEEAGADGGGALVIAQPSEKPIMTYTYRYREGRAPDVVKFWSASARKYYIALNDGPIYYAKSLYVDRVIEDLPKIIAGEEVKSYL